MHSIMSMKWLCVLAVLAAATAVRPAAPLGGRALGRVQTGYDYHARVGIPRARLLRALEEAGGSRIVGGAAAAPGEFPYQAGLLISLSPFLTSVCGGCVLSETRVVTAAHCWHDGVAPAHSVTVVVGSLTLFWGGTRIESADVSVHPDFNPAMLSSDLAMVKLPSSLEWSELVQPIRLPTGLETHEHFAGETALASGYGITSDNSGGITLLAYLSRVQLGVMSNEECYAEYGGYVVTSTLCTSGAEGRGTCGGDSGGPLALVRHGRPLLIGVVSFGSIFGCEIGLPAGYARVTEFLPWFHSQL